MAKLPYWLHANVFIESNNGAYRGGAKTRTHLARFGFELWEFWLALAAITTDGMLVTPRESSHALVRLFLRGVARASEVARLPESFQPEYDGSRAADARNERYCGEDKLCFCG